MGRTQWRLFGVGMAGLFLSMPFFAVAPAVAAACMALSVLVLIVGTLGWLIFSSIRNMLIRRHGVPMVGRVLHCRASGYVNRVPNYEVEAQLPDGTTTMMMVRTFDEFYPGQLIELLVDPRRPGHAVRPARPGFKDF
jgi:hypothetical protein